MAATKIKLDPYLYGLMSPFLGSGNLLMQAMDNFEKTFRAREERLMEYKAKENHKPDFAKKLEAELQTDIEFYNTAEKMLEAFKPMIETVNTEVEDLRIALKELNEKLKTFGYDAAA